MLGDPAELEQASAKKTAYISRLPEAGQLGFWLLTLAGPFLSICYQYHGWFSKFIWQNDFSVIVIMVGGLARLLGF